MLGATIAAARHGRPPVSPDARVDGPRRELGRAAARRRRGRPRRHPRRHQGRHREVPRRVARVDAADGGRSVLAVLGDRRACWPSRPSWPGAGRVRLHTHLAETADERTYCAERFGCTPVEYLDSLGWLGDDVWLAHVVHLDDAAIARLAATGTGVAHCPSSNGRLGAGICRSRDLLAAGVARRPRRRRRRIQRGKLADRRGPAGRADGQGSWRPAGDVGPPGAGAGNHRRRAAARPGQRDRLAGAWQARRHRAVAARHACRTRASPTRWPRSCSVPAPPLELLLVNGGDGRRAGSAGHRR